MTVAFVTGITGQDGSFLVDRLRAEAVEVHGLVLAHDRQTEVMIERHPEVVLHSADLRDGPAVAALVQEVRPDVVFNLGGISSVALSWEEPLLTLEVTGTSAAHLLEACWELTRSGHPVRFLQASSAEIFGEAPSPQHESTPIRPRSPYGAAKALAHHLVGVYRGRGLFAVGLILFNHESDRRPPSFVTRKITRGVAEIATGRARHLELGNLDAQRDWGWAPDYVDAMLRAARHEVPDDYVVATGTLHSVRDFVSEAFRTVGIEDWAPHVRVDPALLRPQDPTVLVGDASRAQAVLGWRPTMDFPGLVRRMVEADLRDLA
jgi:GDPmannose 4,6-dehydratase